MCLASHHFQTLVPNKICQGLGSRPNQTYNGTGVPLGLITAFLMSIAVRARRNKVVTGQQGLLGEIGVAETSLSPSGKVFIHGELWDAVSTLADPAGERIVVRGVDGLTLRVDPVAAMR